MKPLISILSTLSWIAAFTAVAAAQSETVNPEAAASQGVGLGLQERSEEGISITEVPIPAMDAAKDPLNAEPSKAFLVTLICGQQIYEIEAKSEAGEEVAVYVTSSGEVVGRGEEDAEKRD